MDPNQEIENIDEIADDAEADGSESVDDFIKQLEEREKDLHITANTTIIEIAEGFEDGELPDFMQGEFPAEAAKPASTAPTRAKSKPEKSANAALENEIAGLKEKLSQAETDRKEIFESAQRRTKDFENYKVRTERERRETFQNQLGNLATQMLPALDNLNRAVDFAMAMPDEQRVEIRQFFDGIALVNQQVNEVLAGMGVQEIATVGEEFDPNLHEAVATEETEEFEPNSISAELLRGYRIGDRVIRHSMVRVAKAGGPKPAPLDDEPAEISESPDSDPDPDSE